MDWVWFLFSFKGRIHRGDLWQALVVIFCWMSFLGVFAAGLSKLMGGPAAFSFNLNDIFAVLDPDTYLGLSWADLMPGIVHVIGTPLFVWVFIATCVKRLHDRGKSGWWILAFFVIPGLLDQFSGRLRETTAMIGAVIAATLYLSGFVEMYCLRGDRWPNRFGPAPLPKTQARARSGQATGSPAWDQTSAIEFVPHILRIQPRIDGTSPPAK